MQVGMATFAVPGRFNPGVGEGEGSQVKRCVRRNSAQRLPMEPESVRPAGQVTARPAPTAPLPRGQSPGRRAERQPVLPLVTSPGRPESQREPRQSPGSLSPRALAQPVSNRRLRLLSFSTTPPLPPLFFSPSAFVPLGN